MQEADLLSVKSASNIITNELKNANNLNEKLMKRLQDTQKAFEDSISELSILSKKNNELNTQKDVYRNTIDNLRSCVRKMQESIKGTYIAIIIIIITTIKLKIKRIKR